MMLGPDWVAQWSWLVDQWSWRDWVGLSLLLTASLAFASAVFRVVGAHGGNGRRQFLIGGASLAVAVFTSGKVHAVIRQKWREPHWRIFTGPRGQSYFKFGEDVANLARGKYQITPEPTNGSEDNLSRLQNDLHFESVALTQDDVLARHQVVGAASPFQVLRRLPRREQVHIVTLSQYQDSNSKIQINRIEDLKGKRVAIGEPNSGTNFTAGLVLYLAGVKVDPEPIGPKLGLERLFLGENDPKRVYAVFYVVSQPTALFNEENFTKHRLFRFVEIPYLEALKNSSYQKDSLKSIPYDWLPGHKAVPTISVGTALVCHKKTKPEYVEFLGTLIDNNKDRFS